MLKVFIEHQARPMAELTDLLFDAVTSHGGNAPQADDITIVLVRRLPD